MTSQNQDHNNVFLIFSEKMIQLLSPCVSHVAVAVSGGPDSMGLVALVCDYARSRSLQVTPLIVDHGLRSEAADEASRTCLRLRKCGLTPHVLTAHMESAATQARARRVRYALMGGFCYQHNIQYLLVAHTESDQDETIVHRVLKGSGLQGLHGMHEKTLWHDAGRCVWIVRPCLSLPQESVRSFWKGSVEQDPSNHQERFSRVRHRAFLRQEATYGPIHVRTMGHKMAQAWDYVLDQAIVFIHKNLILWPWHAGKINRAAFMGQHPYLQKVILTLCLQRFGGVYSGLYAPRDQVVNRICTQLRVKELVKQNVYGCVVQAEASSISFYREQRSTPICTLHSGKTLIWDDRYRICSQMSMGAVTVSALGLQGWKVVKGRICQEGLVPAHGMVLPGLWQHDRLLWCAFLGSIHEDYAPDWESVNISRQLQKAHF